MTDVKKAVEPPEELLRRHLGEVPRPDRPLGGLQQGVLADALRAAENQGVVDLVLRPLNPVGEPSDDVCGVSWIDEAKVVEPRVGLTRVAEAPASAAGKG